MADKPVVFVFSRAPLYGAVKTRLAREIGAPETLRFFRNSLVRTCKMLAVNSAYDVRLATTPTRQLLSVGLWPSGFKRVDQGQGDLGRRMIRVLRTAHRVPTILVGSDIPQAHSHHIVEALTCLRRHAFVLGPVEDGGYWLIGAKSPDFLSPSVLDGVRWSTRFALSDTVDRLPGAAILKDRLFDIDDGASFRRARSLNLI